MSSSSKLYLSSASFALAGILLGACGPKINTTASSGAEPGRDFVPGPGSEMMTVSVGLAQQGGFQLAGATAYEMALSGCASGLAYASITEANPNIEVYKNDLNCKIELLSFTIGSDTYLPDGTGFDGVWTQGQTAVYANNNPAKADDKLSIYIESQLSSPLTTSEAVIFSYTEAKRGLAKNLNGSEVGNQQSLEVSGQPAPQFEITNLEFLGIIDSQGVGEFRLTVECQITMVDNLCDDLDLADARILLIDDTYSGDMNMAQAEQAFIDNTATTVTKTGNGFVTDLAGPGRMVDHHDLIFIMEGNGSYRYFTINIEALSL